MGIVDYIFYRFYQLYKRNKEADAVFGAYMVVGAALGVLTMVTLSIAEMILRAYVSLGLDFFVLLMLIGMSVAMYFVRKRYRNAEIVNQLEMRYQRERFRVLKGWLIGLLFFSIVLMLIVVSILRNP